MIEAATPMKPKKGAEEGQRSETAASNTVDSILFTVKESKPSYEKWKRGNDNGIGLGEEDRDISTKGGHNYSRNENKNLW